MALATSNEILEEKRPTILEFNSPSVGILSQSIPGPGKRQVLDLGAPARSTIALFSSSPCIYYVEDLNRFFIAPRRVENPEDDDDAASAIANALGYRGTARFDLVLGWDLLSYMDRETVGILMKRIARSCRPGTLLYLVTFTGALIPSAPAKITMDEDGHLRCFGVIDDQSISNPRYSPTALEGMMPGFRLLHSFLLGDQMQEFLFTYA